MKQRFHVIIQRDEDGGYIGRVPELQGCLSQGDTLDELMGNIKEAIELCLEEENTVLEPFVGVQEIVV